MCAKGGMVRRELKNKYDIPQQGNKNFVRKQSWFAATSQMLQATAKKRQIMLLSKRTIQIS